MSHRHNYPPRLPKRLLLGMKSYQEDFLLAGDIEEAYHAIASEKGRRLAHLWFWLQILGCLPKYLTTLIAWRLTMFRNCIKIAFRQIQKHKGYSFINIVGLAIGIACFILAFLYIQHEMSFDRFHRDHDRIYRISTFMPGHFHAGKDKMAVTPWGAAPAITETFPEVESSVRIYTEGTPGKVTIHDMDFFENRISYADENFFEFFTFDLIVGNASDVLTNPYSVVISEHSSRKLFGSNDPIGRVLKLNDETDLVVQGVMADMPVNTQFAFDYIIPLRYYTEAEGPDLNTWSWRNRCYSFFRLRENVDPAAFEKNVKSFTDTHMEIHGGSKPYFFLQPLDQIHLRSDIDSEMSMTTDVNTLIIFGSVAMLILLVACINYMNLTTARSTLRMKETGIRKVIGAGQNQLRRQFLGETFFLTGIAFLLAMGIVVLLIPSFSRFIERSLSIASLFTIRSTIWLFFTVTGVGFLSGAYPAFCLSKFKPIKALNSRFMRFSNRLNLRTFLVVFQFAVSIILLISTLVIKNQLHHIRDFKVGFDREQIVVFSMNDPRMWDKLQVIKNDISQFPNVKKVCSSMNLPNYIRGMNRFRWTGMPEDGEQNIYVGIVDHDFIDLYGLEIVEGRNFSREFPSDINGVFLINETAAKTAVQDLEWDHVINHEMIHWNGVSGPVVGIVKDFHFHSLHRPVEPLYLYFDPVNWQYHLSVKIDEHAIPETIEHIENYLSQYPSKYPFDFRFFDDVFNQMYRNEMHLKRLFTIVTGLAILIAGMGLLGLSSFIVARQTKEIGIRKVLGSTEVQLVGGLFYSFLKWILFANLFAWPVAWWLMRMWLLDFAYHTPLRIGFFIISSLLTLTTAATIISFQTICAAKANPVNSLRHE